MTTQTISPGLLELDLSGAAGIENVRGTAFGDTLYGNDLGNRLYGNGGDDHLYGRGGVDMLDGGTENDVLDGGVDGLTDVLTGGPGRDTFVSERYWIDLGSTFWQRRGYYEDRERFTDFSSAENDQVRSRVITSPPLLPGRGTAPPF